MKKTLIVKLGSAGDVVRTTVILPYMRGDVFWLVSHANHELLLRAPFIKEIFLFDCYHCRQRLMKMHFDLVFAIEEDLDATHFVAQLKKKRVIGMYFDSRKKHNVYTRTSRAWFDMSCESRYGLSVANAMRKKSTKTYQEMLFSMLGLKFRNQSYQLGIDPNHKPAFDVGLEERVGARWPTKLWGGYKKLKKLLIRDRIKVFEFKQRPNLREYISNVNNCRVIVCGDTLAMHLGLALKKKGIAMFSSTPPQDQHDYGLFTKLYDSQAPCFVSFRAVCGHSPQCIDRVSVERVYQEVKKALR
ncbi:MAG: glycosyltransferase family 9 protein [Candidatus Jorgensenbacteria bacterium]